MGISCNTTTKLVKESSAHSFWFVWHRPTLSLLFWGNYSEHFLSSQKSWCWKINYLLFSILTVSDSLQCHGLQHARLPCSSPSPRACSNSCPSSWWCHPTISSCHPLLLPSVFPSIRVFSNESALCIRWPKYWSFSFSIRPSNEYSGWFPSGLTGLISLQSKGLSRISNTTVQKHQFFSTHLSLWSNSHIHTWLLEKTQLWLYGPFFGKVMSAF